jgi:hypothetical protein
LFTICTVLKSSSRQQQALFKAFIGICTAAAAAAAGDEILHATQGLLMVSVIRCYDLSDSSKQSSYVSVSVKLLSSSMLCNVMSWSLQH